MFRHQQHNFLRMTHVCVRFKKHIKTHLNVYQKFLLGFV